MKLFCGQDPRLLGIEAINEKAKGFWDMEAFREHIAQCTTCSAGVKKIMGLIGSVKSEKKAAAARLNASKPPRPGSRMRGRPKKEGTK